MISPKKPRKSGADAQINIVPYIDVMLVLLVIFMMTTPIIQQGVEVDLPEIKTKKGEGGDSIDISKVLPTIISINKEGEYYISSINEDDEDEKASLNIIISRVKERLRGDGEKPLILIKSDKSIVYDKIISLISDLRSKTEIKKVGLITEFYDE